jgi:hypothetical protein
LQHVSPLRGWRRVELRRELIEPYLLEISVGRFLLDLGMAQLTGAREEWRDAAARRCLFGTSGRQ